MAQAILIEPFVKTQEKKIRVAAYCRVSSNSADQLNSYANQIQAYTKLIQSKSGWELAGIYADEGISGMQADNRPEFQKMIQACEAHQVDLIITKSISRFARNVLETLNYVRKLKLLGIGVKFEKEGLNTIELADEMLLNIFSAIAQEESKAISQHQRLSITKRMELGEFVDVNAPYGYRLSDKKLAVKDDESTIVKYIFNQYLNGTSVSKIAKNLTEFHIPTKCGGKKWNPTNISYILSNERYIGDCKYQKKFRGTTVPFHQEVNRGQADMYYATGTHAPVIDKETFSKVQGLLENRRKKFSRAKCQKTIYPLSCRIRCHECGSLYRRKIRGGIAKWVCAKHYENIETCDSNYYDEDRIYAGIILMINKLRFGDEEIIKDTLHRLEEVMAELQMSNSHAIETSKEISNLNAKSMLLEQLNAKKLISPEVYHTQLLEINTELKKLRTDRKRSFNTKLHAMYEEVKELQKLLSELEDPLESFNEKLFEEIVKEIVINQHDEMTVTMLGNLKFTETI